MYTIQSAAWVLGVPRTTVRRWMEQAGIEKVVIEADRVRKYIADIDVLMLSDKHCRKLGKLEKITRRKDDDQDKDLYTLSEVAKFLGVTVNTVRKWLLEAGMEKKYIVTDKRRVYVCFYDILVLVNMHRRIKE
jgi:DNA-binding transcriptional MerR regulator